MVLKIMKSKDSKTNSVPVSVIKTTWSEHPRPYLWHSNRDITEFQFITSVLSANALCQYFIKLIWKILHYLTEKKRKKKKRLWCVWICEGVQAGRIYKWFINPLFMNLILSYNSQVVFFRTNLLQRNTPQDKNPFRRVGQQRLEAVALILSIKTILILFPCNRLSWPSHTLIPYFSCSDHIFWSLKG